MAKSGPAPTVNDVARIAGVSKKTVSRVINRSPLLKQATREKVEKVIAELGYTPNPQARALALRRNFLLGLLHDNPNAQTVLNFQEGVLDAIRDTEFALVVRPVDRHSPAMLDDIRNFLELQRLYGVLILPPISENDELAALCREMGCGYVRMGSAALDEYSYAAESYDAVILLSLAALAAGSTEGADIAAKLQEVSGGSGDGETCTTFAACADIILDGGVADYDGISGPITFDEVGDPTEASIGIYIYGDDNTYTAY